MIDNIRKMMISATDKIDIPENKPSQPPISVMNLFAGYAGTSVMLVNVVPPKKFSWIPSKVGRPKGTICFIVTSIIFSLQLRGQLQWEREVDNDSIADKVNDSAKHTRIFWSHFFY